MQSLREEFAGLLIDTTEKDLCAMIRRVSCKWTKQSRLSYNKVKIQCPCGRKTRRNNLAAHKKTSKCKRWHRRQKAAAKAKKARAVELQMKVKIEPRRPRKRKLKSKIKTVYLD